MEDILWSGLQEFICIKFALNCLTILLKSFFDPQAWMGQPIHAHSSQKRLDNVGDIFLERASLEKYLMKKYWSELGLQLSLKYFSKS